MNNDLRRYGLFDWLGFLGMALGAILLGFLLLMLTYMLIAVAVTPPR